MKRFAAMLVVLACAAAVALPALAADGPVKTYSQDVTLGFYRGQVVSYLDFGPVKLRAGNKVAPIWAFTNGDDGHSYPSTSTASEALDFDAFGMASPFQIPTRQWWLRHPR